MWKSIADMDYVCLTCHYVDNDWKLQKKIINFFPLGPSELGQDVSKTIMERLQEWNIDGKLCVVLLDNCSTSDFVASELIGYLRAKGFLISNGDLFYARSCGNLLNAIVHKSLEAACEVIDRVRVSVQFVKSSQERLSILQKNAEQIGILEKPLVLDAPSNWPSTYMMLETACHYQEAFKHLAESDVDNASFLSPKDWEDVRAVIECLDVLYQALDHQNPNCKSILQ
ncbi:zinc finger BED domain-containing protein RICESLEEPER 2-like [Zingiber officinale]|uniref:zinc finger BED domain-containing protein RICESLEEPER 2-like n=1 Tax=Zingiber officinale TaxID=94328 RepID=UPI001C4B6676|nr:zinc finger BED domain-containing protein RICESLEEPER 2-like [Zingiber officinale]